MIQEVYSKVPDAADPTERAMFYALSLIDASANGIYLYWVKERRARASQNRQLLAWEEPRVEAFRTREDALASFEQRRDSLIAKGFVVANMNAP